MNSIPVQAWIFKLYFHYWLRSVHNWEENSHIQFLDYFINRSKDIFIQNIFLALDLDYTYLFIILIL